MDGPEHHPSCRCDSCERDRAVWEKHERELFSDPERLKKRMKLFKEQYKEFAPDLYEGTALIGFLKK